ncbi:MAG: hypothetical protein Q8S11_01885 [Daejeonella sp.]|uniref:hypothetical protein n=1 Tax=Daejeonella sp. TaxID=2805397 RepID=UPI0027350E08|nr:hypothetical protein [Daejeonella sp.]MDP3467053.1 hypothetical protein [Daejeonella sp.]
MKAIVIKLLALLILINFSSCSTRKLNRQKFESSVSAQSEIRMQDLMNDKLEAKRKILLTDTTNEQYSVIIFPADTFSFSAQHGFKGSAERIELSGKLRRVISRIDSAVLLAEKQRDMNYEEQYESKKSEVSNSRVLEKKGWHLVNVLIIVLVLILVGWCLWGGRR